MGRLTRTCLKLCQSTSNVVITPRFKRDWIPKKLPALFPCFISRWLEYANEIFALGSRKLVFYFNIGVFHRQSLPPTFLHPPLPILKKKKFRQSLPPSPTTTNLQKKNFKKKNKFKKKKNFKKKKLFQFFFKPLLPVPPYLSPQRPAPASNCHCP